MIHSEYKVGQVCVIVKSQYRPENIGKQVTILGPLHARYFPSQLASFKVYRVELQGSSDEEYAFHENLKPINPPKPSAEDEAFRSFMDRVMKPAELTWTTDELVEQLREMVK